MPVYDLKIDDRAYRLKKNLNVYRKKGYTVKVNIVHDTRSISQNQYYWVLCKFIGKELGYTKDEIHVSMKEMLSENHDFMKTKVRTINGKKTILRSTSTYDKSEFSTYLESILNWSSNQGIILPTIEEYKKNKSEIDYELSKVDVYQ